ncbi:MAG: 3-oxoacyl-ACP synthase [Deltaproteobacteria bacterium]|nr:3-oxoacyl-ACP synthase [Deltaproteobacteria bacterium]
MTLSAKIESLGVYLPDKSLTTEELLGACRHRPRLDFERITGIHERRVAEGEYSIDLAVKAAQRALKMSRYSAEDLDLLICTSISKHHRQDEFTFEPATAVLVRRAIGARRALCFDVVNACAGMLNGIYVLQGMLRSGAIRCGMVVSGEQNMPLAWTATREIRHRLDRQLASLSLGDCGAALILDGAEDDARGFRHLELITGAKHSHYCHSQPSSRGSGGVLITKAIGLQRKGAEHFPFYFKEAVHKSGWGLEELDHIIPHQVSVRAIRRGIKEVSRFMGCELPDRYLCCAEKYGNTTTTSHFLVLHEFILRGQIQPGHKLLFVSGASGIVITHATYAMDDLPDRYRRAQEAES